MPLSCQTTTAEATISIRLSRPKPASATERAAAAAARTSTLPDHVPGECRVLEPQATPQQQPPSRSGELERVTVIAVTVSGASSASSQPESCQLLDDEKDGEREQGEAGELLRALAQRLAEASAEP